MNTYENAATPIPIDEIDSGLNPAVVWTPKWLVDCGKGCEVGITIDDHCFVVLAKNWADQWMPTTHIPWEAAGTIGDLSRTASL